MASIPGDKDVLVVLGEGVADALSNLGDGWKGQQCIVHQLDGDQAYFITCKPVNIFEVHLIRCNNLSCLVKELVEGEVGSIQALACFEVAHLSVNTDHAAFSWNSKNRSRVDGVENVLHA